MTMYKDINSCILIPSLSETELKRLRQEIQSFCDQWISDASLTNKLPDWINNLSLGSRDINGSLLSEKKRLVILLYIFVEMKNFLLTLGFYTFRKHEAEKTLQKMVEQVSCETVLNVQQDDRHRPLIEQFNKAFPSVKLPSYIQKKTAEEKQQHIQWLRRWLARPHFSLYKEYYNRIGSPEEKEEARTYAINSLALQISHPPTRRTLFQILTYHKEFDLGFTLLRRHQLDPLLQSIEEKNFVQEMSAQRPELTLPLYMQWIESLVEKKTTKHYKVAASFLSGLKENMFILNQEKNWSLFLSLLKSKYKSYKAFNEELKKYG
ncbi:hypothetical protein SAMN05518684_105210 [Salipaludibacillus aurantiacus]|uniref:Uncharacterized protein n=2 Tax=Salipaludibacillus aurantiacus TaxID=1601833 RepID=A0A1H9TA13_9BACI|nr:hypothetical protein SAMN05518684_105210 [Salipaludibacillus aurantiacus]